MRYSEAMRRCLPGMGIGLGIAALLMSSVGCAGGQRAGSSEDQPLFAAGWSGPPPRVNVTLAGPEASGDKQARCRAELQRAGAVIDETGAAAQAVLTLQAGANRMALSTARRGLVREEPRPDGSVERLCNDALYSLVVALRAEQPATTAAAAAAGAPRPEGPALSPPVPRYVPTQSYSTMPGEHEL